MDGRHPADDWLECHRALDGFGLDEEETKAAWHVSRNRTNPPIAEELGTTLARVKWLLVRVFLKLGVENRHELAEKVQDRIAALRKRDAGSRRLRREEPPVELRIVRKARRRRQAEGEAEPRSAPDP